FEDLAAQFPDPPSYRLNLALAYHSQGNLLDQQEQRSEAEKMYRQAVLQLDRVRVAVRGEEHRQWQGVVYNELGLLLQKDPSRFGVARQSHEQALRIRRQLVMDYPDKAHFRFDLMVSQGNLGDYFLAVGLHLTRAGQDPLAEQFLQKAKQAFAE